MNMCNLIGHNYIETGIIKDDNMGHKKCKIYLCNRCGQEKWIKS